MLAILPAESRRKAEQSRLFAPDFGSRGYSKDQFDLVHRAVSAQQALALRYRDEAGNQSQREVLPLGLFFWGERWLLVTGASCVRIIAVSVSTAVWRFPPPGVISANEPIAH